MDERSIAVIVRQLARARGGGADDEVTARHILQALTGLGWRQRIEPPPPRAEPVPATAAWKAIRAEAGK
jgi:hypothetical protein